MIDESLDILIDDNKTKEELLESISYSNIDTDDFDNVSEILYKVLPIPSLNDAKQQLIISKSDFSKSVKCFDKRDNKIYGVLIFSDYHIIDGSPITSENIILANYLFDLNCINGFAFVIDKRLRGTKVHRFMINKSINYISSNYDFIWCGVEANLKSHNYWQKMGFINLFNIDEASFYIYFFDKLKLQEYLLLKEKIDNEQDDNYFRNAREEFDKKINERRLGLHKRANQDD